MLLPPNFKVRRTIPTAIFGTSLVLCLGYLYLSPHDFDHVSLSGLPWPSSASSSSSASLADLQPLPFPYEYDLNTPASAFCDDRFNRKYLFDLRRTAFQYCNASSYSSLTCFHSHTSNDDERDSLCMAQGVVFDAASQKFVLNCDITTPDENATERGVIPFAAVRQYWYDTGPRYIFDNHVSFVEGDQVAGVEKPTVPREVRFSLLIKREGELNPWHCLLEIWSMAMAMDVLQMSRDPATGYAFLSGVDRPNVQVVILDDRLDGPYFDLWKLFSGRAPLRLNQIAGNPEAASFYDTANSTDVEHRLIVPLAGASNPTWQNDWIARDCTRSDTLRVFVARVLRHYGITQTPAAPVDKLRVTFIDRKDANTRRLADQDQLLEALRVKYGDTVEVEAVDFGTLSFAEQLQKAMTTDVLVGVHGAGLTHVMFLREHTSAVVEIQPTDMGAAFMGFRNIANMRGVSYFRTHATPINETEVAAAAAAVEAAAQETPAEPASEAGESGDTPAVEQPSQKRKRVRPVRRAAWHTENFEIDHDTFVRVVGAAIEAVANKGTHQKDVA
ncbi:hypothetical protein SEUCBS139899_010487 [Sporothrix eucalyptigena]